MKEKWNPLVRGRFLLSTSWFLLIVNASLLFGCRDANNWNISVSHYDPSKAYGGYTYLQAYDINPGYLCVDMNGRPLWALRLPLTISAVGHGLNVARDGNVLALVGGTPTILNPVKNDILWVWKKLPKRSHHSIIMTPWGTLMFLEHDQNIPVDYEPWGDCRIVGDVIKEVDIHTHEVLWEWHLHEHVEPVEHHFESLCTTGAGISGVDWSHCNTVKYYENYWYDGQNHNVVLLNSRELSTFWMIDYDTSEILWSCGQHGTIGRRDPPEQPLFSFAHEVDMLEDGNFIMFDNGNFRDPQISRALEIHVDTAAGTAEEVWSWTDPTQRMYAPFMGDANRLPNGNTLLTDVMNGRLIEVTPDDEKVWQLNVENPFGAAWTWIYKFERVQPWPDCVDSDEDGYGAPAALTCPNWGDDCDDTDPEVNPGAQEGPFGDPVCTDTIDNDCDGFVDGDDEGCQPECTVAADCDDSNPCTDDDCVDFACVHVNNTDPCDDSNACTTDDVCAGGVCTGDPLDGDGDTYVSDACAGDDCDDSDPAVNPGAQEGPFGDPVCTDTIDNDCDGFVDGNDEGCQPP